MQKWKEKIHRIRQRIAEVERNNANKRNETAIQCQRILMLNNEIRDMGYPEILKDLFQELEAVAYLGLTEDLKQMLPTRRSKQVALNLLLNGLTDVVAIVKYLNRNSHQPQVLEEAGLTNLTTLLGKELEVLCKLQAKGIEVSKAWARNLGKKAPDLEQLVRLDNNTLKSLCQGAEVTERSNVYEIIFEYTIQKNSRLASPYLPKTSVRNDDSQKEADIANLKKAKQLCSEAKTLSQPEVWGKIVEIVEILDLPKEWLKEKESEGQLLLETLGVIIDECTKAVESDSAKTYERDVEVMTKASAGRALCAVYYSKYETPKPAFSKLLQEPTAVKFANPVGSSQNVICKAFSKAGLALKCAEEMSGWSFGVGAKVSGLNGMLTATDGVALTEESQSVNFDKTLVNNASALYYIRTDKQTFQFKQDDIRLSSDCVKEALRLVQDPDDSAGAREFLESYGSHFPTGVQTLGGIFFTTADVKSESHTTLVILKKEAKRRLESQMSIRFLSETVGTIDGNLSGATNASIMHREQINNVDMTFSYLTNSIGPPANYATFHKLLSYNSHWALIDRGELETAKKPVWLLIKDLGGVFKDVAKVLEDTWKSDELKRKNDWDKIQQENNRKKEQEKAKEELQGIKDEHLNREVTL